MTDFRYSPVISSDADDAPSEWEVLATGSTTARALKALFQWLGITDDSTKLLPTTAVKVSQTGIKTTAVPAFQSEQTVETLVDGSSNTGTDSTMSTAWIAVKFTAPASPDNTIGDLVFRLKKSGTFTNPAVQLFGNIYSDSGGLPGSKLTNLTTGATIFGTLGTLTDAYQEYPVGFNRITLTPGTSYWATLNYSAAPAGGSIVFDSAIGGGSGAATSANGSSWSGSTAQVYFKARGQDFGAVYATTVTNPAIYGLSVEQSGVSGVSYNNSAVNGLSYNSYGVAGVSTYSLGVYGVSTHSIGIQGISRDSQAGSFGINGTSTANNAAAGVIIQRTLNGGGFNVTGPMLRIQDNPSNYGTWQARAIEVMSGSTVRFSVLPRAANTAGTAAYLLDTETNMTNADARIVNFGNAGSINAWITGQGAVKGQRFIASVGADRGDANQTLRVGVDSQIQRWATTLTANRTVTLSTTDAQNGDTFRIVRTGLGAFTLDVGGLKTIPSATAAAVEVAYDGSAWVLIGYQPL